MPDARVHPTAVVGHGVVLGDDVVIGPFAVIGGRTLVSAGSWIGAHAVVGAPAEIRGGEHDPEWIDAGASGVTIGERTVIREAAQVHAGSEGQTSIGADCFIMNQAYIAHDCILEDGVTLASHVSLAGHVRLGRSVNLGLATSVHQRRVVGPFAMVGMSAAVTRDIPPFQKAYGVPARVTGLNRVGMQRAGFTDDEILAADSNGGDEMPALSEYLGWYRRAVS